VAEAVGIEHRAIRLVPTILERFRRQVSMRTPPKNTKKKTLPDILMTISQISDVNQELAEVGAMFAVFDVLGQKRGR
jgi:hypothetical protein